MFVSCKVSKRKASPVKQLEIYPGIKYAQGFRIYKGEGFKQVNVINPWMENKILASYLLIEDSTKIKEKLPDVDFIIKVPVEKIVCMSTVYYSMLKLLRNEDLVSGITDIDYVYDTSVISKLKQNRIKDMGNSYQPNIEKIIDHHPDIIFKYLYVTQDRSDDIISYADIPVIYMEEFTEHHPLGRLEWMKLMAAFTGEEAIADSVFSRIEKSYLESKAILNKVENKPVVLTGYNHEGGWVTWGSGNYLARLITDAGGNYFLKDDPTSGIVHASFETVYNRFHDADYWLSPGSCSFADLKLKDSRHLDFAVAKRKQVYSFCKRQNASGGLDYYESGVTRPDILLKDIGSILHPEVFTAYERVYWEQLQ